MTAIYVCCKQCGSVDFLGCQYWKHLMILKPGKYYCDNLTNGILSLLKWLFMVAFDETARINLQRRDQQLSLCTREDPGVCGNLTFSHNIYS